MAQLCYELPDWLPGNVTISDLEGQVRFAIALSRLNVEHGGGPFGCAVFDAQGALLGRGVNLVLAANCSLLHAEVVAIQDAQRCAGTWDLGALPGVRLVASCQPCAMCFGAVLWSGACELVYAASAVDASAVGFDEGPLCVDWTAQMAARGIRVQRAAPPLRAEAITVLQAYGAAGRAVYNPTRRTCATRDKS